MRRTLIHISLILLLVAACICGVWGWRVLRPREEAAEWHILRYDRVLDEYVSLGSYTALHRMNTEFPRQTKILIEDVLALGPVDKPDVERELRHYFLEPTRQTLLDEVHTQYADLSDLEAEFVCAFEQRRQQDAAFRPPRVYALISGLHQSIIVRDSLIGISLDKYLGPDFPLYQDQYPGEQRARMVRSAIVGDAMRAYDERE